MRRPRGRTATRFSNTSTSARRRSAVTSTSTKKPTIAELKAVGQPPEIFYRNSGEHWAGRLYMRRLSPYVTRALLPTRITPNALTWLMMLVGLLAAGLISLPGIVPALGAVLLI